jgi:hypothetical protein
MLQIVGFIFVPARSVAKVFEEDEEDEEEDEEVILNEGEVDGMIEDLEQRAEDLID